MVFLSEIKPIVPEMVLGSVEQLPEKVSPTSILTI
jgi:hypothetical protein